jgi:hypothetical protein
MVTVKVGQGITTVGRTRRALLNPFDLDNRQHKIGSHQHLTEELTHGVKYIFRTRGVGSSNESRPSKARRPVLNLGTFL